MDKKIYIIQGEIGNVVGAIKRNSRWNTHTPLVSLSIYIINNYPIIIYIIIVNFTSEHFILGYLIIFFSGNVIWQMECRLCFPKMNK